MRWDVTRCGQPVLRQAADVSLAGHRVLASALISDPARTARTLADSPTAVAQRVDQHTLLVSVLDGDATRPTAGWTSCAHGSRLTLIVQFS